MVSITCKKCGFIVQSEQNEKCCPNCSSPFEGKIEETITPGMTNSCPVCGATIGSPNAKFCPSCGNSLTPELGQAVAPPTQFDVNPQASVPVYSPPPQNVARIPQKIVAGSLIKSVPFANMIVAGGKISGGIQLRRDGVLFITKAREVIQCHITDIVDVTEGEGHNVIVVSMINSESRTFTFAGARRWIDKIYKLQGR